MNPHISLRFAQYYDIMHPGLNLYYIKLGLMGIVEELSTKYQFMLRTIYPDFNILNYYEYKKYLNL